MILKRAAQATPSILSILVVSTGLTACGDSDGGSEDEARVRGVIEALYSCDANRIRDEVLPRLTANAQREISGGARQVDPSRLASECKAIKLSLRELRETKTAANGSSVWQPEVVDGAGKSVQVDPLILVRDGNDWKIDSPRRSGTSGSE